MADTRLITYKLPLRSDFDFEITLPRDLTTGEAEQIGRWLQKISQHFDSTAAMERLREIKARHKPRPRLRSVPMPTEDNK